MTDYLTFISKYMSIKQILAQNQVKRSVPGYRINVTNNRILSLSYGLPESNSFDYFIPTDNQSIAFFSFIDQTLNIQYFTDETMSESIPEYSIRHHSHYSKQIERNLRHCDETLYGIFTFEGKTLKPIFLVKHPKHVKTTYTDCTNTYLSPSNTRLGVSIFNQAFNESFKKLGLIKDEQKIRIFELINGQVFINDRYFRFEKGYYYLNPLLNKKIVLKEYKNYSNKTEFIRETINTIKKLEHVNFTLSEYTKLLQQLLDLMTDSICYAITHSVSTDKPFLMSSNQFFNLENPLVDALELQEAKDYLKTTKHKSIQMIKPIQMLMQSFGLFGKEPLNIYGNRFVDYHESFIETLKSDKHFFIPALSDQYEVFYDVSCATGLLQHHLSSLALKYGTELYQVTLPELMNLLKFSTKPNFHTSHQLPFKFEQITREHLLLDEKKYTKHMKIQSNYSSRVFIGRFNTRIKFTKEINPLTTFDENTEVILTTDSHTSLHNLYSFIHDCPIIYIKETQHNTLSEKEFMIDLLNNYIYY